MGWNVETLNAIVDEELQALPAGIEIRLALQRAKEVLK